MTIAADAVIAIVGLGYVGLPLAIEFGKKYRTIGFDLSDEKISSYREGRDPTGEVDADRARTIASLFTQHITVSICWVNTWLLACAGIVLHRVRLAWPCVWPHAVPW